MHLKNKQKIFIALLAVYVLIAIIMMVVVQNKEYTDDFEIPLWTGSIIGAIMLICGILLKAHADNQPKTFTQPNGEKPNSLGTFSGIGHSLLGAFHFRESGDTWVSYTFVLFFIPLFPTGCYRVKLLDSEYNGIANKNSWAIYGSEKGNSVEIGSVYLIMYGLLLWLIFMIGAVMFSVL